MTSLENNMKLVTRSGRSVVYGVNRGKYPCHHFQANPLLLSKEIAPEALVVSLAGDDEWVKGCFRKRLDSNLSSLELVVEGKMRFKSKRGSFMVEPGQVFLVHFGEDSEMMACSNFLRKKTIILPGNLTSQIFATLNLNNSDVIDMKDDLGVADEFDRVVAELADQRPGFSLRASQYTFGILLRLSRKTHTAQYPPMLADIIEFIYTGISRNLTLKDICEFAGTSPGTLNNLFNRHFGVSPIEYVLQQKIKVAKNMLLDQHRYIKEIAAELGYANQFYFALDFKKRTGISPSQFRKKNLQEHED